MSRSRRASAVIGLSPKRDEIRQLIAGMASREIKAFDDVEPAMDWLAGARMHFAPATPHRVREAILKAGAAK